MGTSKGKKSIDQQMTAKDLAGYKWQGMANGKCRAIFEGSEPIKVSVGTESEQKTWYLPKEVLIHCSPFFYAALNGNFKEASSKSIKLPEDDPIAFEIWAAWLSLGECKFIFEDGDSDITYVRAWELGDKFACPAFKDHVMAQILYWLKNSPLRTDTIRFVYGNSSPGSKLRRVYVDAYVWYKLNGDLTPDVLGFIDVLREVPEFLEDSVKREMEVGKDDPWKERYRYCENPAFDLDD